MIEAENVIHSEPGRFWLVSEDGVADENKSAHGRLTVRSDGQTRIEITDDNTWDIAPTDMNAGQNLRIGGYLYRLGQSVLIANAHFTKPGHLGAYETVLTPEELAFRTKHDDCIKNLTIQLGVAWAWRGLELPDAQYNENHLEIKYPSAKDIQYKLPIGTVTISVNYNLAMDLGSRSARVKPRSEIRIEFEKPISLEKARRIYTDIEDLLVLMTNQELGLEWPEVTIVDADQFGTLYASRLRPIGGEVSFITCWVTFPDIAQNFGAIFETWLTMKERYGAAFHLYLGTRRGRDLYVEHRFINLIWGLEALHEKHWPPRAPKKNKEAKIQDILSAIDRLANSGERKAIERALRPGPTLEQRLRDLFTILPADFTRDQLTAFAKKCADRRNAISHEGGPREGETYSDFIREVHELACALDPIYHYIILSVIGVPTGVLEALFRTPHKTFRDNFYLKRVGLVCDVRFGSGR